MFAISKTAQTSFEKPSELRRLAMELAWSA